MKMCLGKRNLAAQILDPNGEDLSEKSPGDFNSRKGAACSHLTGDWLHLKSSPGNMAAKIVYTSGGNGSRSLEVYPVTQSR
jgi:hypothetical protein